MIKSDFIRNARENAQSKIEGRGSEAVDRCERSLESLSQNSSPPRFTRYCRTASFSVGLYHLRAISASLVQDLRIVRECPLGVVIPMVRCEESIRPMDVVWPPGRRCLPVRLQTWITNDVMHCVPEGITCIRREYLGSSRNVYHLSRMKKTHLWQPSNDNRIEFCFNVSIISLFLSLSPFLSLSLASTFGRTWLNDGFCSW